MKAIKKATKLQWSRRFLGTMALMIGLGVALSVWWYQQHQVALPGSVHHSGLITVEHWVSPQGTRVYFSKREALPMIDVRLQWEAGTTQEQDQVGLAALTHDMLKEGSVTETANQFAERLEAIGVDWQVSTHYDYTQLSFRVLNDADKIKEATSLIAGVVSKPAFRQEDMERIRKELLAELDYQTHDLSSMAELAFRQELYGKAHPYGRAILGDIEHLQKWNISDVKSFHEKYYSTRNLTVTVVGDTTSGAVQNLVQSLTKGLPNHMVPLTQVAQPKAVAAEKTIAYPSSQIKILIASPGIARESSDRHALQLGNQMLGGSILYNRLAKAIRVEKGLAYSPKSFFDLQKQGGTFQITLGTRKEQAKQAQLLAREVLEKFIQEGPTLEELERAKKMALGEMPLMVASNASVLNLLSDIGFHGLPLDSLDNAYKEIAGVSAEQIKAAFAKYIDPQKLITVAVGGS